MNTSELIAMLNQRLKDEREELEERERQIIIERIQFDNKIKSIDECSATHKQPLQTIEEPHG